MLTIRSLESGYGGIRALRNVDLSVHSGQIVALIGANGAGKSTLINTICGVVKKMSGDIVYCGEKLESVRPYQAARMGMIQVPEGRQILGPLTVRENLELGAQALGRRGKPALEDRDRIFSLFPRVRERQSQLAGLLSGGEQQMLAISRALMGRPQLLLLDEPSLGLAPIVVSQVYAALRKLNEQMHLTMLIVEQNARLALETAHYAYVLENGQIVQHGKSEALRDDPGIRASYLGMD